MANSKLEVKLHDTGMIELVEVIEVQPPGSKSKATTKRKAQRQAKRKAQSSIPRRNKSPRFIGLWTGKQSTLFVVGSARVNRLKDYCALDYETITAVEYSDYNAAIAKRKARFKRGKNWKTKPVKVK